jgi:hypothetical protein
MGVLASFLENRKARSIAATVATAATEAVLSAGKSQESQMSQPWDCDNEKTDAGCQSAASLCVNYCNCGEVGIFGFGWSLQEPERARWFCAGCVPPQGRS